MASFAAPRLHVIGAGLAGSALATQMAQDGVSVTLYDSGEPFASRWTRGMKTAPEDHKVAEPEIFYDPEDLVRHFFAQWPEIPRKLIRPAHAVIGLKHPGRSPAIIDLDHGIAAALIARRPTIFARLFTAWNLWLSRYASEDKRVRQHVRIAADTIENQQAPTATYHQDALATLAEVLFSMPAHNCSASLLGRVLLPTWREMQRHNASHAFAAIDPIILNDIALPALRDHFIAAGGDIISGMELGDIDSTADFATDLFFGDEQIEVRPQDAVVLALHPRPLCDAVPDIGMPPAPAHRRTFVFQASKSFAEPCCVLADDDLVRAIYCNRRHIQVSMNSSLILPSDGTADQLAATIWQRVTELCDQHLNLDLSQRTKIESNGECPAFSYVDCEAPFPELSPGVAALRHRLTPPWRNLFLCGDAFPPDYPPGPAAVIASVRTVRAQLHEYMKLRDL
ncbi:amine oxidase [Thalassospira lucentensis]|uniref:Amine oxidase n=1 Tax=Thalassospira lucentensis TaxID=168935 RepID=A0A154L9I8_9PROT|nr:MULTISPECIES: NAD(P)-binding protein [Thalassospira]KZB68103.1 amine oxidase [Thalassospira lucentensis]MCH2274241.1 NAD(P)-binding protein [Thalassospira sp.]